MAARRGVPFLFEVNSLTCPTYAKPAIEIIGELRRLSNPKTHGKKENPGALAGATGMEKENYLQLGHLTNQTIWRATESSVPATAYAVPQ